MKTLSPTQKRSWLECRGQWDYNYQMGLVPTQVTEAMDAGRKFHEVLADYYQVPYEERSEQWLVRRCGEDDERTMKFVRQYWKRFGRDSEVVGVQTEAEVRVDLGVFGIDLVVAHAFVDALKVTPEKVIFWEHKTGEKPDQEFYAFFNPQIYDIGWMLWEVYKRPVRCVVTCVGSGGAWRYDMAMPSDLHKNTREEWEEVAKDIYERRLPIIYTRTLNCKRCFYYELCFARVTGGLEDYSMFGRKETQ